MHLRQSYLEAVQSQIKTIAEMQGVWIQRRKRKTTSWPNAIIYATTENIETLTGSTPPGEDREQSRALNFSVKVFVKQNDDQEKLERDLNAYSLLIEKTLRNTFDADDLTLQSVEWNDDYDPEDPDVDYITLTYTLTYPACEFTPETP
jgi:hypothetical protein